MKQVIIKRVTPIVVGKQIVTQNTSEIEVMEEKKTADARKKRNLECKINEPKHFKFLTKSKKKHK